MISRDWLEFFEVPMKLRLINYRHHYHEQVVLNLQDTILLIHVLLSNPKIDNELVREAIKCFQVSGKPVSYAPSCLEPTDEPSKGILY